ncbi:MULTISPECIES: DegT/DnrJ/EryC1/StrS aminotransferase family protein [unclassified Bacillus (in: firmicutes)]|uniref:DegT/DnrJ/EryC1/StrS family aminotransferase n=1 Tax=unclassified Bacillus (in: firmicutes) TaxID=185979 RepID=UPI001BE66FEE|nr:MULTISPECIES: DegT/DnrJ/EryC1/StrS aminotransferase family protein [unclassified Bacillus (in: firmicutes)]MBT2616770.1 DegT/DnrJ/EryC1/StrS aminotransferase family protein [Bacillus sp. ISL-78]MBT2631488.1 DegT/DnrJ/EryC1/StrS aminotransferase family protein [Bacillus sp. ISL-101]
MRIPFSPPDITQEEINEVVDTLKGGWITTGPKTKLFEKQIAAFCNTSKAVTMNSATSCMEMTLRLLGIGEGDEVITSAYTYTASASVIEHVGAKIVLVDTAKDSYHLDYDAIAGAITEKTKAIIPVDIAGVMCDYNKVFEAVNKKKDMFNPNNEIQKAFGRIVVIADAAHSFGASFQGRMSGEVADFTCFSFHAVKNLTTAEGGAVTWRDFKGIDDDVLYKEFVLLTLHGQDKDALAKTKLGNWEYDIVSLAYKCNMTDIMASIGLVQLKRYSKLLEKRKQIIEMYDKDIKGNSIQVLSHFGENFSSSGHLYLVRLSGKNEGERNKVIEKMAEKGIATNVHYKPLPMHTAYKNLGFSINDFPNAYAMYENEITLPLHTCLTKEQVDYIISNFKEAVHIDKEIMVSL